MSNADETEKLRMRVIALEEELARRDEERRPPKSTSNKLIDLLKEVSDQGENEGSRLGRSLLLGYAEYLRQTNQILGDFIEGIDNRDRAYAEPSAKSGRDSRADDVITELREAVRSASSVPQAVIDRISEAHREERHRPASRSDLA